MGPPITWGFCIPIPGAFPGQSWAAASVEHGVWRRSESCCPPLQQVPLARGASATLSGPRASPLPSAPGMPLGWPPAPPSPGDTNPGPVQPQGPPVLSQPCHTRGRYCRGGRGSLGRCLIGPDTVGCRGLPGGVTVAVGAPRGWDSLPTPSKDSGPRGWADCILPSPVKAQSPEDCGRCTAEAAVTLPGARPSRAPGRPLHRGSCGWC